MPHTSLAPSRASWRDQACVRHIHPDIPMTVRSLRQRMSRLAVARLASLFMPRRSLNSFSDNWDGLILLTRTNLSQNRGMGYPMYVFPQGGTCCENCYPRIRCKTRFQKKTHAPKRKFWILPCPGNGRRHYRFGTQGAHSSYSDFRKYACHDGCISKKHEGRKSVCTPRLIRIRRIITPIANPLLLFQQEK